MSAWNKYKETMITEESIYDLCRSGNLEKLKQSLDLRVLNEKNEKGYSPLMLAAYNEHLELTKFLLEMGADPNSQDLGGNSILMGVAFKGNVEIAKVLLDNGADLLIKNQKHQTALDFANMFGRIEMVKFLKSKLNIEAKFKFNDVVKSWLTLANN